MNKLLQAITACCVLVMISSCSGKPVAFIKEVETPVQPLSCIVVLPAGTSVDKDDTINYKEARILEKGASFASSIISRELRENPRARVLTSLQADSLISEISGGISGTVKALGEKVNCDGVLQTTVSSFEQRKGGEYGADSPASAEFKMVLFHASKGSILWSADFKETQKSFLSNIFSLDKKQSRGFKWMTVEQLMTQGIEERLADCPYLK